MVKFIALVVLVILVMSISAVAAEGPVAVWSFDEGSGAVLTDSIGNANGKINGARWVKIPGGSALRFNGENNYVDCGNPAQFDIKGPFTLEVWINPDAPTRTEPGIIGKFFETYCITYYQGSINLYVSGGGNGLAYPIKAGEWNHIVGSYDGTNMRLYVNGMEIAKKESKFKEVKPGNNFYIGCVFGDTASSDPALRNTNYFAGMIDSAKVYKRAISAEEVVTSYNKEAADKGRMIIDPKLVGSVSLTAFSYPKKGVSVLACNYLWIKPVAQGVKLIASLTDPSGKVYETKEVLLDPNREVAEIQFATGVLAGGKFVLKGEVIGVDGKRIAIAETPFTITTIPRALPSLKSSRIAKLPLQPGVPTFNVEVSKNGGIMVDIKGKSYLVESTFSYPGIGFNAFTASSRTDVKPESSWLPVIKKIGGGKWKVTAEGNFYSLNRSVNITSTRIEVSDTFINKSKDVVGIIFANGINNRGVEDSRIYQPANPSVYVSRGDSGLGIVALDDVYYMQSRVRNKEGSLEVVDDNFGIAPNASYTVKWAIYPTSTADYFEMVNRIRKDEKINGIVEGSVRLVGGWGPQPADKMRLMNVAYPTMAYLSHAYTSPRHVSIEGWEYMEYPEVCERLKKATYDAAKAYPATFPFFHVAHNLFFTNKAREIFADSIPIDENGNSSFYGPDSYDYYGNYVDKKSFDEGWRWYNLYPTMNNSFGKYTLEAVKYTVNEIGSKSVWADGYVDSYVRGGYLYNEWDNHSVTMDPATGKVLKTKGMVYLLSRSLLIEVCKMFNKAGGPIVTNGNPGPFSYLRDARFITSCETGGGDQQPIAALYFGSTVTPLGNQAFIKTETDIYKDILTKLDLGALYFWYGDQDLVTDTNPVTYMYPITFDSIGQGYVRGLERIVTKVSGIYGWPNDKNLHAVYYFDSRGKEIDNPTYSTIDADSVRTTLNFGENESAVIVKIPMKIIGADINARIETYNENDITLVLNGEGSVKLEIESGMFKIGASQKLLVNGKVQSADKYGKIIIPLNLNGEYRLAIKQYID